MNCLRLTFACYLLILASTAFAQDAPEYSTLEQPSAVVAAQTSSPTNYALLEPIANQPQKAPVGLLQPMATETPGDNESVDIPDAIVVTPVSFKRGLYDEYQFRVRNTTEKTLLNAKLLFKAPEASVVEQVSPKPDSVDGLSILLTVNNLAPGEDQMVDVTIKNPRNEFARFDSTVLVETWERTPASLPLTPLTSSELPQLLKPKVPVQFASATKRTFSDQVEETASAPKLPKIVTAAELEAMNVSSVEPAATPANNDPAEAEQPTIKSWMTGPATVKAGEEVDFAIEVQNTRAQDAQNLIVQLSIPQNMKVTILDREAWYDAENRKISWDIKSLEAVGLETIRYKAVVKESGKVDQSIVIGEADSVVATSSLETTAE